MSDTLTAPVAAPVTSTVTDGALSTEFNLLAVLELNQMLEEMGDRRPLAVRPMTGKHVGAPGRVAAIGDMLRRIGTLDSGWFGPRSVPPSRLLLAMVTQSLLDVAVVPVCICCNADGTVIFEIANYDSGDHGPHTATHTIMVSETELTWIYEGEGATPCLYEFTTRASHQVLTWVLDAAIEGKFGQ